MQLKGELHFDERTISHTAVQVTTPVAGTSTATLSLDISQNDNDPAQPCAGLPRKKKAVAYRRATIWAHGLPCISFRECLGRQSRGCGRP